MFGPQKPNSEKIKKMKLKEKTKCSHASREHIWECLKKYELSPEEENDWIIGDINPEGLVKILKNIKPNEYLEPINLPANESNTKRFFQYIELLKEFGLDIGKEGSEYGFKMPLPKKGENYRNLIIFRRWKK